MTIPNAVADLSIATTGAADPIALTGGSGALYFESASDLVVYYIDPAGAADLWVYGTDYTIAGDGSLGAGVLTPIAATAAGGSLSIYRATSVTQPAHYEENDGFPAKTHERVQDRDRLIDQDLKRTLLRTLRVPPHEPMTEPIPAALARAGKIASFDQDGDFETELDRGQVDVAVAAVLAGTAAPVTPQAAWSPTLAAAKLLFGAALVLASGFAVTVAGRTAVRDGYEGTFLYKPGAVIDAAEGAGFTDAQGRPFVRAYFTPVAKLDWFGENRAAMTVALATANWVSLTPGKTYDFGQVTSAAALFTLAGIDNRGVRFNGAKIVVQTMGDYSAPMFALDNMKGFTLGEPCIEDSGFNQAVHAAPYHGIVPVRLSPATGPVSDVHIERARFKNVVTSIDTDTAVNRASGIWLSGSIENCVYGINLANNGDDADVRLRVKNHVRAWHCYGVKEHDGWIKADGQNAAGNAEFLVKANNAAFPTSGIRMAFISKNSNATTNPRLVFESQNDAGDAKILDCDIYFDDAGSVATCPDSVCFRHFRNNGAGAIAAGAMVALRTYKIVTAGSTDFTLVGAPNNNVGQVFTASGPGAGTGTATTDDVVQELDPNTKGRLRVRGNIGGNILYQSRPTATQDQCLDDALGPKPAFSAILNAPMNNATGDGTVVDIVFNQVLHDTKNCYNNATGEYTADRDGMHRFGARMALKDLAAAHTRIDLRLNTPVKTFFNTVTNTGNPPSPESAVSIYEEVYLKKGQKVKAQGAVFNSTKVVDINGDGGTVMTTFTGGLIYGGPRSS